ncbi:LOW QUALITY PROTEIN: hypothetical protein YC2023_057879 [Brassica napus]
MKDQPVSQQSNKNMTDRSTQHHGPEALLDGLGTIRVTNFTPRPTPVHPLTRPAASRHKALQPLIISTTLHKQSLKHIQADVRPTLTKYTPSIIRYVPKPD